MHDPQSTAIRNRQSAIRNVGVRRFRRGAFILPSLMTIGNIFFGFYAVVLCMRYYAGNYMAVMRPGTSRAVHLLGVEGTHLELAALLILVAAILDLLDGRIARLTGTYSDFGTQLDSLADVVSFGVAPGILAFTYSLSGLNRGWVACFLFLVCGAVRLARFNTQVHRVDGKYFVGLPIPAAALLLVGFVLALPPTPGETASVYSAVPLASIVIALAFLMVSTIRYRSFKDIDLRRVRSSRVAVVLASAVAAVIAFDWCWVLFLGLAAYAVSGPLARLFPADFEQWVGQPLNRFLGVREEEVEVEAVEPEPAPTEGAEGPNPNDGENPNDKSQ